MDSLENYEVTDSEGDPRTDAETAAERLRAASRPAAQLGQYLESAQDAIAGRGLQRGGGVEIGATNDGPRGLIPRSTNSGQSLPIRCQGDRVVAFVGRSHFHGSIWRVDYPM